MGVAEHGGVVVDCVLGDDPGPRPEHLRLLPLRLLEAGVLEVDGLAAVHAARLTLAPLGEPLGWLDDGLPLGLGRVARVGGVAAAVEPGVVLGVVPWWAGGRHQHVLKIFFR